MAAAGWDRSPGAGPLRGVVGRESALRGAVAALETLAKSLPAFGSRLPSKEQLDERQQTLAVSSGSVEHTGSSGDQMRVRIADRIGRGTFCVVFRGELLPAAGKGGDTSSTGGIPVAAKFELRKNDSTQLRNEFRMYKKFDQWPGTAKIYTFGEMDFHKVLVMDLLGPSLESLFQDCGRRFSVKTVAMLAKQMIARIQAVHEGDLIYRDVKPENFLMGLPGSAHADVVHLIDYGMAKMYRDPDTNRHISFGEAQSLSGTARYMSINAHCRRSQSRRDDLEALGHVFLYFVRGNLPWQGIKAPHHDARHDIMCERKQATSIEDLCRGFPAGFAQYLAYTRSLAFDGDPDYDHLRGLFAQVLEDVGAVDDGVYDWHKPTAAATTAAAPAASEMGPPPPPAAAEAATAAPQIQEHAPPRTPPPQHASTVPVPAATTSNTSSSRQRGTTTVAPAPAPAPASPPGGKRRRSDFTSDLQPPTRVRAKKASCAFYDSEAQRSLATLFRDVMAARYAFHRAVKQSGGGGAGGGRIGIGASAAARAAAAAAAKLAARNLAVASAADAGSDADAYSLRVPSLVHRRAGMLAGGGGDDAPATVIAPSFTEALDRTLGQIISELEDMSDKLLQDGDWTGAARVRTWLDETAAAVQKELERLRVEQKQQQQQQQTPSDDAPAAATQTEAPAVAGSGRRRLGHVLIDTEHHVIEAADPLEVDDPEEEDMDLDALKLRTNYLLRPGRAASHGTRGQPRVDTSVSPSAQAAPQAAPQAAAAPAIPPTTASAHPSPSAGVRAGIDSLSLGLGADGPPQVDDQPIAAAGGPEDRPIEALDALAAGDDDDSADSTDVYALVYRTASGTRKVVRLGGGGDHEEK